jgi:hypothetical protein
VRNVPNIPAAAVEINFKYGRSLSGRFYVWKCRTGRWLWDALGNNGEAYSQEEAISQTREWIMYDYDPLNSI